jgi:autotransporter-associated beta strand protein
VTYGGNLAGSGTFTKRGQGTLILTAANNITGQVTISEGTLRITNAGALGNTGSPTLTDVSTGDKLEIEIAGGGTISNEEIQLRGTILLNSASGDVTLAGDVWGFSTNIGTFNIIDAADTLTISGTVGRSTINATNNLANSIIKTGSGTLALSGANTLRGTTTVNAGTLSLSGTASSTDLIISGGSVTTSGGNKTFDSLTFNSGSLLANTGGVETLTFTNASTWTGGTYVWNASNLSTTGTPGTHYDFLQFSSSLNFTGASDNSITIDIRNIGSTGLPWGESPSHPNSYKIMEAAGGITAFNPDFFNLSNLNWTDGGNWWQNWTITQNGNALYLANIQTPEPSTYFISLALLTVIGIKFIRIKSKNKNVNNRS